MAALALPSRRRHRRSSRRSSPATARSVRRHPLAARSAPRQASVCPCARFCPGATTTALHHENPAFRFDAATRDGDGSSGVPTTACRRSHRSPTRPTRTSPTGIATSSTTRSARAGSTASRISRRPAFSTGISHAARPSGSWPPTGTTSARRRRTRRAGVSVAARRRASSAARQFAIAPAALRRRLPGPRAATARTVVAGYPWFTDWGRDTFIALRGLCLATGRLDEARAILLEWAGTVSEGMLPNRFPDHGDAPEFNAVDASLWYVVAVHDFLHAAAARRKFALGAERSQALARPSRRSCRGYVERHALRDSRRLTTACSPPGNRACSSRGWMPRSATGW